MNAATQVSSMSSSRMFAAYLGDMVFELRRMLRNPMFAVPTLVFPAMFYLIFAVAMGYGRGNPLLFANYTVFGAMAPGLFGFGVSLAFERELGTLTYRQALPAPPGSYLLARMVMAMIFVAIIVMILTSLALFVSHLPLTVGQIARVFVIDMFGVLPFGALGMFVGAVISGQAAPAVINLIYLPMAFLSGILIPYQSLNAGLKQLAPIWPSYHLDQLVLAALGQETLGTTGNHVAALAGVTFVFFLLAMRSLAGHGLQLLGAPRGAGFPLRRIAGIASFCISIGLVITGFMGGTAKVTAAPASTAATSEAATGSSTAAATAADESGAAAGVAAPAAPLVANFDDGTTRAAFGDGWNPANDKFQGGNSTAEVAVVTGGADGSKGALEVKGTLRPGTQFPFAGTMFWPVGMSMPNAGNDKLMDFSSKKTLHFRSRGDGRGYTVLLIGATQDGIPPMYGFVAGPDWQDVDVPLDTLERFDAKHVRMVLIGALAPPGDFRFQLDDIELR